MKKCCQFSLFVICCAITISCTKQNDAPVQPPAVIKSIEAMLSDTTWKLQEARFLQNSSSDFTYYNRGVTSNGNTYDIDSIHFNIDYTGRYTNSGGKSNFTWKFQDAQKTKLAITFPVNNFTVNWENLNVTVSAIRYTEYYTEQSSGLKSEGAFFRTPR